MSAIQCWIKRIAAFFILSFLLVWGTGCTTYKEAVAAPMKVKPFPAQTAPSPSLKVKK